MFSGLWFLPCPSTGRPVVTTHTAAAVEQPGLIPVPLVWHRWLVTVAITLLIWGFLQSIQRSPSANTSYLTGR